MENNKTKKYPSKVSYAILVFIFIAFFAPFILIWNKSALNEEILIIFGSLFLVFIFIFYLFFTTSYLIKNKKLIIKCGMFSYTPIEIMEIKEISKTRNIISSPAPSFDRIEIKYGKFEEIIISPKDKFTFIKELTKINPNIKNNVSN